MHHRARARRQGSSGVDAANEDGRPHSGQDARARGEQRHEEKDRSARQPRGLKMRHVERRRGHQPPDNDRGDQERPGHAAERQQRAFREGAHDQPPPLGAKREMDGQR
ncbi:MAG TPA: hypothetical protein VFX50_04660, partial [Gemmatimonadales bacterium]|nr:hypothetical protein [Gemmatimonadales bacterium]